MKNSINYSEYSNKVEVIQEVREHVNRELRKAELAISYSTQVHSPNSVIELQAYEFKIAQLKVIIHDLNNMILELRGNGENINGF